MRFAVHFHGGTVAADALKYLCRHHKRNALAAAPKMPCKSMRKKQQVRSFAAAEPLDGVFGTGPGDPSIGHKPFTELKSVGARLLHQKLKKPRASHWPAACSV